MKSLKIMIVSLIFSVSAYAGTIHVPADYPTIQAAIDAALPRDQILVDSGMYVENLDFMGKEIMLQSKDGPENTTIEALCPRPVFIIFNIPGENALLEGFRITGGRASIGGIARGGDAESWYDSDAYGGDAWGAGVYIERSWENNFVDCLFSNNISTGGIGLLYYLPGIDPVHDIDGASFGGAVYSGGATGFLIENSVFNSNSIADDNEDSMGSSFFAETSADCIFDTIINSSGASAIESPESINIHNLISCIVYFNEDGPGTFQAEFSDIEGGASGSSNFDADPEFKDNHGFHISGISPCIDTGKTYSLDHDIDGDFRPFFLGYDVGADEYTGTLPTATPAITPTPDPSFSPMTDMSFMATPSPPPTATPSEVSVSIVLPRHYVIECDLFWVDIKLWNTKKIFGFCLPGRFLIQILVKDSTRFCSIMVYNQALKL